MRILITHLTRMGYPRICVAGIDLATGEHVRPVRTAVDPLTFDDTRPQGGVFELAGIVELGDVVACGNPPETEDHRYERRAARFVERVTDVVLWETLESVAQASLENIFGADLREQGRTYAIDLGGGHASLGCLRAEEPVRLHAERYGDRRTLRLAVQLDGRDRHLAVTDLRLFTEDFSQPHEGEVRRMNQDLHAADEILLAVGLARPFARAGDVERHWLQVNSIYCH